MAQETWRKTINPLSVKIGERWARVFINIEYADDCKNGYNRFSMDGVKEGFRQ